MLKAGRVPDFVKFCGMESLNKSIYGNTNFHPRLDSLNVQINKLKNRDDFLESTISQVKNKLIEQGNFNEKITQQIFMLRHFLDYHEHDANIFSRSQYNSMQKECDLSIKNRMFCQLEIDKMAILIQSLVDKNIGFEQSLRSLTETVSKLGVSHQSLDRRESGKFWEESKCAKLVQNKIEEKFKSFENSVIETVENKLDKSVEDLKRSESIRIQESEHTILKLNDRLLRKYSSRLGSFYKTFNKRAKIKSYFLKWKIEWKIRVKQKRGCISIKKIFLEKFKLYFKLFQKKGLKWKLEGNAKYISNELISKINSLDLIFEQKFYHLKEQKSEGVDRKDDTYKFLMHKLDKIQNDLAEIKKLQNNRYPTLKLLSSLNQLIERVQLFESSMLNIKEELSSLNKGLKKYSLKSKIEYQVKIILSRQHKLLERLYEILEAKISRSEETVNIKDILSNMNQGVSNEILSLNHSLFGLKMRFGEAIDLAEKISTKVYEFFKFGLTEFSQVNSSTSYKPKNKKISNIRNQFLSCEMLNRNNLKDQHLNNSLFDSIKKDEIKERYLIGSEEENQIDIEIRQKILRMNSHYKNFFPLDIEEKQIVALILNFLKAKCYNYDCTDICSNHHENLQQKITNLPALRPVYKNNPQRFYKKHQ